jgi:hypothetical protein
MTRIAAVLLLLSFQAFAGQSARDILAGDAVHDIVFDARNGAILGLKREIVDVDLAQKRIEHAVIDLRDDWKPGVRLAVVPLTELSLPRDLGEKVAYNFARERLAGAARRR